MSTSGFHAHFKAVTTMSPLQFQKHLRLEEARRLMLNEKLDAGEAGYRVGYDDHSHFSRDYKRHFGEPPMRDVERMESWQRHDCATAISRPEVETRTQSWVPKRIQQFAECPQNEGTQPPLGSAQSSTSKA